LWFFLIFNGLIVGIFYFQTNILIGAENPSPDCSGNPFFSIGLKKAMAKKDTALRQAQYKLQTGLSS